MKPATLEFLAKTRAEIDFQSVSENLNPYEFGTNNHTEYNIRFNELEDVYEELTRSAA
jgi:hypothetical protein